MKLVSLCPSNTELVGYLELTSHLVAVDDYSDWPVEVNHLPRLGPDLHIDMDKLADLNPDLVLASLSVPGMERNIQELEKRKIPYVVVPNPTSLEEVNEALLFVGEATNTLEKAEKVSIKYTQMLEHYRQLSKQVESPKQLYWEWWGKPIFTPGASNWLTELSQLAGGENIFQDQKKASVQTTWDEVCLRNPEVICVVWVGVQRGKIQKKIFEKREGWHHLSAVQNNQVYILDEPLFCRPSPRLLLGVQQLAHILHPNIYGEFQQDPLL